MGVTERERSPGRANVYLAAMVGAACGCALWWLRHWQMPTPRTWAVLALFLALTVLAQHFPLALAPGHKVNPAVAAYFAVLLLLGAPLAVPLTAAGQLLGGASLALRRDPHTGRRLRGPAGVLFNAAQLTLAVALGGTVLAALLPARAAPLSGREQIWAIPAAAAALYLVNRGAVVAMIALRRGRRADAVWRDGWRLSLQEATGLYTLGLLAALLAVQHLWAPLLLVPPAILLQRALQHTADLLAERDQIARDLAHEAAHDALTGVLNRGAFQGILEGAVARPGRAAGSLALLFIDLDDFKAINDRLGHAVGDLTLISVAKRLVTGVRAGDTVARFGGDEFVVLLDGLGEGREAIAVAERLAGAIREPVVSGRDLTVTASIGVGVWAAGMDAAGLLRAADRALYGAKARDRAGDALVDVGPRERILEEDLRRALVRGEFRLVYQPIVALATGATTGFEALVRWEHPIRGELAPGAFIPLAEETGLIVPLGQWVLREACRQLGEWHTQLPGGKALTMGVNLSARQLAQRDLVAQVERALAEAGIPPASLHLEITESVLIADTETAHEALTRLHELGVRIPLDDFGVGYSSLSYLRRFPIDTVKIDRSFVHDLLASDRDRKVVGAMVALAHSLGLGVTAEGVETFEQKARLEALGCDHGQGYFFGHPVSSDDAAAQFAPATKGDEAPWDA